MPRVRALSNHAYCGQMRIKGTEYDAADTDLDLLISLSRVVPVEPTSAKDRTYSTRELQASFPHESSTRVRRRARQPISATPAPSPNED